MSILHVRIDDNARLTELVDRLGPCDEIRLERGDRTVARVVPAHCQPYVGLYGNHPFELRRRPVPHPPELTPDDFMD